MVCRNNFGHLVFGGGLMATRSREPFFWAMFSGGGMLAALFMPALAMFFLFAFPLGWVEAPTQLELLAKLDPMPVRFGLFVLVMLSLFHSAHRIRFTLYDGLQLSHLNTPIAVIFYGIATVLSFLSAYLLWTF